MWTMDCISDEQLQQDDKDTDDHKRIHEMIPVWFQPLKDRKEWVVATKQMKKARAQSQVEAANYRGKWRK